MSHHPKITATAVWNPWVPQELRERFDLPGVSLRHRNFLPEGRDALLVFGGDGTVHLHLQEAVAAGAPLLVVPAGSGNDFAAALGIRTVSDALRAWKRFVAGENNVRAIDLGIIHDLDRSGDRDRPIGPRQSRPKHGSLPEGQTYFCCIAGTGFDATVNRRANSLPRWLRGRGGYIWSLLRELPHYRSRLMRISADAARFDEPALLAAFANAPAYGGGMKIAPRAQLDDALLDLVFVRQTTKARVLRLFPTVFFGGHLRLPEVRYQQAARIRVETDQPSDLYADGEFICRTPIELSVAPKTLNVIVP